MTQPEIAEIDLRGHALKIALHTKFDRQFWLRWVPNGWEADTFDFVERNVTPGSVFLDIGAWIGPISLYAAAMGARVISLEPDPVSLPSLQDNARMNTHLAGSIEVRHTAFDARPGKIKIFGNHKGFGTSGSTAVRRGWRSINVDATTAEDLIAAVGDQRPVVIKVDIEAHEYFCASALARLRSATDATMHMSLHPSMLEKSLGWRRWLGRAPDIVLQRTSALLKEFADADVQSLYPPHEIDDAALRDRLYPEEGQPGELIVVARPRG